MADDEHRAEIEAVARIINRTRGEGIPVDDDDREEAREAIDAIDRLRDGRGDDEADDPAMPYPQGMPWHEDAKTARSPQDEDHDD